LARVRAGQLPLVFRYCFAGTRPRALAGERAARQHAGHLGRVLEALWNVDFFFRLATGKPLLGLSAYMFDPKIPLFIRGLSCFHIVLPLLLLWMLHQLGYDQRAFLWQTIVALVVLPLSYLVSNARENVNWVYGLGENPQRILPAPLFVILLMLLFPLAVYLPTHLLFARIFRAAGA
jgi:hypothetical protein